MKIGDIVEIIKSRKIARTKVGQVYTVEAIQDFGIQLDSKYWVSPEEVKLIKTNMKKSDLKDGMVCKRRDGHKCLFLKDKLYQIINDEFICLSLFSMLNENLINKGIVGKIWDIVEIHWIDGEVIWQREETTELTMQEIADKFNIEVTNLKIKK